MNRRLSKLETLYLPSFHGRGLTGTLVKISGNDIPEKTFELALKLLFVKHPSFQTRAIIRDDGWYGFEKISSSEGIDISSMFEYKKIKLEEESLTDEEITERAKSVLSEDLPRKVPLNGPYFRINHLRFKNCTWLAMSWSHLVMDGRSREPFLKDLLTFCDGIESGTISINTLSEVKTLEEQPDGYEILSSSLQPTSESIRNTEYPYIHIPHDKYTEKVSNENMHVDFVLRTVNQPDMSRIHKSCREKGVTIGSALTASFISVLRDLYAERIDEDVIKGKDRFNIKIGYPLSVRTLLPGNIVGPEHVGNFAVPSITEIQVRNNRFQVSGDSNDVHHRNHGSDNENIQEKWQIASDFQSYFDNDRKNLTSTSRFLSRMQYGKAEDIKVFIGEMYDENKLPVLISNTGIIDVSTPNTSGNNWRVESVYSSNGFQSVTTIFVGVHTVKESGNMNICGSFIRPLYSREVMDKLMDDVVEIFSKV
eukprot:TRINITY_DN791_c0_g2_i1.p1 TRINITY_DN791_c0_g2~~TRINITY_DN791_c0_g2_i1.p1  ORF type:complete len:480 (-),score=74.98 TRINITY_DN791_c0_g2_i1:647-2086(-)